MQREIKLLKGLKDYRCMNGLIPFERGIERKNSAPNLKAITAKALLELMSKFITIVASCPRKRWREKEFLFLLFWTGNLLGPLIIQEIWGHLTRNVKTTNFINLAISSVFARFFIFLRHLRNLTRQVTLTAERLVFISKDYLHNKAYMRH